MIANVYADCEEGQIDINSATKEDLDTLYGIGSVKAAAIINARPFDSVDELIKVSGIGNWTLEKIKEQGLACVNGIDEKAEEEQEETKELVEEKTETINEKQETNIKNTELKVIKLTPQIIKSKGDKENSDNEKISGKVNYPLYGFVIFCFLLGFLFIIKKNRFNKNEFR